MTAGAIAFEIDVNLGFLVVLSNIGEKPFSTLGVSASFRGIVWKINDENNHSILSCLISGYDRNS